MFADHILPAFGLGFALGSAPGPITLLLLSETAKRGFWGGIRVMVGANGTLFAVMVALALGFSAATPSEGALRALRIGGGLFLIWLGAQEIRALRREARDATDRAAPARGSMSPTMRGIVGVLVNPGAWIFFATTAASVIANATAGGGTRTALFAAVAMTAGVSVSDTSFTLLGSGGVRLLGERRVRWFRTGLSGALAVIGVVFLTQGVRG